MAGRAVAPLRRAAVEALAAAGVDTPVLDAELLLGHVLDADRASLRAHPERVVTRLESDRFHLHVVRLRQREPLPYLLGWREFLDMRLRVSPAVLIPRPETEVLVETLAARLRGDGETPGSSNDRAPGRAVTNAVRGVPPSLSLDRQNENGRARVLPSQSLDREGEGGRAVTNAVRGVPPSRSLDRHGSAGASPSRCWRQPILDVGTGSGCVAIGLARLLPDARIVALDISPDALEVARENALEQGVAGRVEFIQGEFPAAVRGRGPFAAVAANPPYLPSGELCRLPPEVAEYEPAASLDGGPDGLTLHRALATHGAGLLLPGGWLAVEVAQGQADTVLELLRETGLWTGIDAVPDLAGIPRVVVARRL